VIKNTGKAEGAEVFGSDRVRKYGCVNVGKSSIFKGFKHIFESWPGIVWSVNGSVVGMEMV